MGLNDDAWQTLFERHRILDEVSGTGSFEISADQIRTVREPRLMAKFDHQSNLPDLFKKHNLSILPVSRSRYVIGRFNVYQSVKYQLQRPTPIPFPNSIQSIDPANLYSESAALSCAYACGMIDDLLGEKATPTVSGRMSSGDFQFLIETDHGTEHPISVANSQIEIDGGYESPNYFLLLEAKKERVHDFLVRQLYYPYRLWTKQLNKKVLPVFFTFSNDVFSFFIYEFSDDTRYHSLKLVKQQDYIIAHDSITNEDIRQLVYQTECIQEPEIPFPQADNFARIVDLLSLLMESDLSKDEITSNYNFDVRQTNYYTSACMYLGLVERYINHQRGVCFKLTTRGRKTMNQSFKRKYLSLAGSILEHEVFRKVFEEYQDTKRMPGRDSIVSIMKGSSLYKVERDSTYYRRAQTLLKWVEWILTLRTD